MAKEKPIIQQIKDRKWIGHTLRKDSQAMERQVFSWRPQGRRKRGRYKRTWRRSWSLGLSRILQKPNAPEGVKGSKSRIQEVTLACPRLILSPSPFGPFGLTVYSSVK
jgi:hypothetical protein